MIIGILILGLVLRLVNLNQSLWLDEAVQAVTAQQSFGYIFQELTGDFHPPLYHILIYRISRILGFSEVALRFPSVLFGVATIYLVYLIAKEIFSPKIKLSIFHYQFSIPEMAALFLATAPLHIYYSQEARMYAMTTFFAALSMYCFLKMIKNQRLARVGYVFSTILLLYSDYFGLLILLAQAVAILVKKKHSQLVICLIPLLSLIPWLPMVRVQLESGLQATQVLPEWGRLVNLSFLKALPLTFIKFSLGRITIFNKKIYAIVAGLLFAIYGGVIFRGLKRNRQLLILFWLFIPVVSAWLLSFFVPNYQPFRLLLVLPAFYLLLAHGAFRFPAIVIYIIIVIILGVNLASTFVYYANPYFHREDWRGLVKYIEAQEKTGMAVLPSANSDWPWRYYSAGKVLLMGVTGIKQVEQNNLADLNLIGEEVYYIRYLVPLFDPQEKITSWLSEKGFVKIKEMSFNQIPLWVYQKR